MFSELWIEGVIVEFKDRVPCERAILRKSGKKEIILADIKNGAVYKLDRSELDEKNEAGRVIFLSETRDFGELKFLDLTEKEQRETNKRYQYIKKLKLLGINKITEKSAGSAISSLAQEREERPPHWQTVRGWFRSFTDGGERMSSLAPKHRFKGHRKIKIDSRVLGFIKKEGSRYFKGSQPTIASMYRNVEAKVIAHNLDSPGDPLTVPTFNTVQKRLLDRSYQYKQKSRKGSRAFQAELANAESGIVTSRILERIEIDHTLLDLHVLHDDYKTLLGRPNITVLIDHYSHMVLGFQLSFEDPSFASVSTACMNAFLPKDNYLEKMGCNVNWPAHGIPAVLVTDNGNEFWGRNFKSVADEIGSIFQYCPIRKGNYKSRVERFFGIVNSYVLDDLPGVVRKIGKGGESYDARQEAKMTLTEFKRYFLRWLADIFHNTPINDSGMTPNELWINSVEELPVPVEDEMELMPILMAASTRELSKGGIRLFSMNYNSSILKDLYRRDGPVTVTIKYNPFDIGFILVLDELNKVYLKINCESFSYASGLSLYEHKTIKAEIKKIGKSKIDNLDMQRAKVKLGKEREELHARNFRRKSQVTISKAARIEKIGVESFGLALDNSIKNIRVNNDVEDDNLSFDGWDTD